MSEIVVEPLEFTDSKEQIKEWCYQLGGELIREAAGANSQQDPGLAKYLQDKSQYYYRLGHAQNQHFND